MILQDKDAKRWLKIANCNELTESIESFPENERDGLSDMQILADEVSYRLSLYTEEELLQVRNMRRLYSSLKILREEEYLVGTQSIQQPCILLFG